MILVTMAMIHLFGLLGLVVRLPGSSGKVATLTPEGVIAFWKILRAEEKGESRLEQTISD
jgi:hypothetical protein